MPTPTQQAVHLVQEGLDLERGRGLQRDACVARWQLLCQLYKVLLHGRGARLLPLGQ